MMTLCRPMQLKFPLTRIQINRHTSIFFQCFQMLLNNIFEQTCNDYLCLLSINYWWYIIQLFISKYIDYRKYIEYPEYKIYFDIQFPSSQYWYFKWNLAIVQFESSLLHTDCVLFRSFHHYISCCVAYKMCPESLKMTKKRNFQNDEIHTPLSSFSFGVMTGLSIQTMRFWRFLSLEHNLQQSTKSTYMCNAMCISMCLWKHLWWSITSHPPP